MEKKDLILLLDHLLIPIGFKRKGNSWVINDVEITKIVNLQKSQYNHSFYINYGYIIKAIPLDGMMMHIYNRLSSSDSFQNERITSLLDLENEISDEERKVDLIDVIKRNMIAQLVKINTEEDMLSNLKQRDQLNDIPLVVKRYFDLPI